MANVFDPCAKRIVELFELDKGDAKKIIADIDNLLADGNSFDEVRKDFGFGPKSNFWLVASVKAKVWQRKVQKDLEDFVMRAGGGDVRQFRQRLNAFLVGDFRQGKELLNGVAQLQKALVNSTMGMLFKPFGGVRKGLLRTKLAEKGFQRRVVLELHDFNATSKTGDSLAHSFARAITEVNKNLVKEFQSYGVPIRFRQDRITAQYHDPHMMLKPNEKGGDAKADWIAMVVRLSDEGKTFQPRVKGRKLEEILPKVYDKITGKQVGDEFDDMGVLLGLKRDINFKDADAWMEYSARYSHENHIASILNGLEGQLNKVVLIQRMGTAPKKTFQRIQKQIEDKLADPNLSSTSGIISAGTTRVWDKVLKTENAWAQVSGEALEMAGPGLTKFTGFLNAVNVLATLGKAVFSSFPDIASAGLVINSQFKNTFFHGYHQQFKILFSKIAPEIRQDVFRSLGVGIDGVLGASMSRHVMDTPVAGFVNKLQQDFFLRNGLDAWTDYVREGLSAILSNNFARHLNVEYANLPKNFLRSLDQYGISAKDWALYQRAGSFRISDLHKHLKGQALADEDLITPDWLVRRLGSEADTESVRRLQNYFVTETRVGVPEPGPGERAIMFRDYKRGSGPQAALALLLQFQSYPVTISRRLFPRMAQAGIPMTVIHMQPGVLLAYAGMMAKDVSAGREPRSPFDISTWVEAYTRSGLLGLVGDALGSALSQDMARGLWQKMGPNVGHAKDAYSVFAAMANDEEWGWEAFGMAKQFTPYANLFYTEWAFNNAIFWNMKENMRPGYLQSHEMWLQREKNQEYLDLPGPLSLLSPEDYPYGGYL